MSLIPCIVLSTMTARALPIRVTGVTVDCEVPGVMETLIGVSPLSRQGTDGTEDAGLRTREGAGDQL